MKIVLITLSALTVLLIFINSFSPDTYSADYYSKFASFKKQQENLLKLIESADLKTEPDRKAIIEKIAEARKELKSLDIWFRYLEPIAYKKINGPLPVEWETEVFEKFEKPYKREGAGLTLAAVYLDEEEPEKKHLMSLIKSSLYALETYSADSITSQLKTHDHFFLCNRLFILNLASIYTTGFECPDTTAVIPELRTMMAEVLKSYHHFNESFPATPFTKDYLNLYQNTLLFIENQPSEYSNFNHFGFIRDFINPLYEKNQDLIKKYSVISKSNMDYALSKTARSIFDKALYKGQNPKGIFYRVQDEKVLAEIDNIGKMLFFDPILSGNNERSCASCHKSGEFLTDTLSKTSLQFDHQNGLPRNTPSLVNVGYNHLIMMDGKHISLQDQTKGVILNMIEMGADEKDVLKKVLSCKDYKKAFSKFLQYTPQEKEVTIEHLASAVTHYYSKFSKYYSPFDQAMNSKTNLDEHAVKGFNLFMSKAQCATCHFVPQFNGVKPPYVGSEFEVIGVPAHKDFSKLSNDKGRFEVNQAEETMNAFRTGTVRNAALTKPYMHNGVFTTLEEVIDFYDTGGGAGKGLEVPNQTLSSEPLNLSKDEKQKLISFIKSLSEDVEFEPDPDKLPVSSMKELNKRNVGGNY